MKTKIIILFVILLQTNSWAQKRPMTIDDAIKWNSIRDKAISTNGEYITYRITPNKGDANLFLYNDKTTTTLKFERGEKATLGYNNNLLIFKIVPQTDSLRLKRLNKVKKKNLPKDSLGIYIFDKDSLIQISKIKKYYLPKRNSNWLAYTYEYKTPKDSISTKKDSLDTKTDSINIKKKEFKQKGNRLVLLNCKTLKSYIFDNISEVASSQNGKTFAFIRQINNKIDSTHLYIFDTKLAKEKEIFNHAGESKNLCLNKQGNLLAYIYSSDTSKTKKYNLWYFDINKKMPNIILDTTSKSVPLNWGISEYSHPKFSDSGNRLYFEIAPFPKKEPKDTLLENEKVHLDIWSWTDKRLQAQQLVELKNDLKKKYKAFYNFKNKQIIQLEDSISTTHINKKIDAEYFLIQSDDKYKRMMSWDIDFPSDYYLLDAHTGQKERLSEKKIWDTYISPKGLYTLIWDAQAEIWSIINNKTHQSISLTKNIDDIFYNEQHSTPSLRGSQHMIGWSKDEKWVYIYSQYDIWKFDVTNKKAAINLTKANKKEKNEFNFQKLDYDKIYLPDDSWMLHSFNHSDMSEGFYKLDLKTLKKEKLIHENKAFYPPIKAKNSDVILWANTDFNTSPELKISKLNFSNIKILTDANPQQKQILWGNISIINWTDFNGDSIKGLLIVPEDFDSNKKYPVITYFYEKYTDRLNKYWTPRPSHSTINFPFYTSNGYIIFVPDINYGTGLPGKDAYNSVVSGAKYISQFPYVDSKRMAMQGQSWGGYQVAYLVTQTNLFACAMAGAPVSNMTSAYGGIRWESGMSRMFQYEHTQSRIGGTLWERRDKYIENSPVFFADRVETPLLIMHNDGDGAVPWYQGIEYFVALRRLNKPVWLLNYNGDSHNLRKWPNRVDLTKRMFSFFEYYLKSKSIPAWMSQGLPATKKGKELRY